ncbi:MAG TPA: hypothetical protein VGR16_00220 [Thermomicrobiales bacterium]|nr:hypothetical protein [Thermomicrobiales bacterium]
MSDSGQARSDAASASPASAPWWGQTSDDPQPHDQPQEASGQQAGATEASFWDRVEDAARGQKGKDPFQSWESGLRPLAVSAAEPATAEDATEADVASPEPSDEPPALVTFAPSWHGQQANTAASAESQDGEDMQPSRDRAEGKPAFPAADSAMAERRGGALIAELDGIARDLAEARSSNASAMDDKLERLRSAIENARDRPREIDAMLALSGQLDTLADLLAMNERMAAAIDAAVRALRGEGAS